MLPIEGTGRFDPFFVLHELGPVPFRQGRAIGSGDRPHRGFETINDIINGDNTTANRTRHEARGHHALAAGDRGKAFVLTALQIGEPVILEVHSS